MNTIPWSLSERHCSARIRECVLQGKRIRCVHCGSYNVLYLKQEARYHCKRCRKKTSLTQHTWLRYCKIPWKTFICLIWVWIHEYPIIQAAERCGVSIVTVRRYYRLFRQHLAKPITFQVKKSVQVDEAYFGSFVKQANSYHGTRTYKVVDKVCVAGIGCPETGMLYAQVIREIPKGDAIRAMICQHVPKRIIIYADGSFIYTKLSHTYTLIQITHDQGFHNAYFIEGCWSYMKRKLFKMYHHFDRRYAEEYIAELVWRFNTRKKPKDPWYFLMESLRCAPDSSD